MFFRPEKYVILDAFVAEGPADQEKIWKVRRHAAKAFKAISPEQSLEEWKKTLPAVLKDLYIAVKDLGGTISGEHGIGHKRKEFMPLVLGEAEINSMKSIKKALDPNNILNPGKIFDMV